MFQSMKITNRGGYEFEMLKFKQFRKPKLEDIKPTMLVVFRQAMEAYFETEEEDKKQKFIKEKLSPGNLVLAAFNRRFPEILIYNMNTDNTFMYNAPVHERDYQSWESFINGKSLVFPSGSGGQIVAALSLVCMMLTSHRGSGRKDRKTTLIMDNPFANAVSEHVLDPIFAVADMKNIQWVVVCPPELVKLGVSNRFPIYYAMSLKKNEMGREMVVDEVNYGMRMYERAATS
ncbi:hypothetical protein D3C74_231600 [compost metagenome]